jgi:hypothetical protein
MKTKQFNLRVWLEVIDWVNEQAALDDRTPGIWLSRFLAPHMKKDKPKKAASVPAVVEKTGWVAPPGLNERAWLEFEQHRKDIKKPMTDTARTKAANQICNLPHEQQQATIDKSIQSRWAGLFPEKVKVDDNRTFLQKQSDATREALFGNKGSVIEGELDV